jgi:hypothetical protein
MVSGWRYYCKHRGDVSLREYLSWDLDPLLGVPFQWVPQARWLEKCNIVLRFERLAEDFAAMCTKIGIKAELPHMNKSEAAKIADADADLIRCRFREDCARFYACS